MAVYKPTWLRNILNWLNWDILTWRVYVGDAIEDGLDWALDWINYAIDWANNAWARAGVAWDKAVEIGRDAWNNLVTEAARIWNTIGAWWDRLLDWWQSKISDILDWIDVAKDWLLDRIDDVRRILDDLGVKWDNFWTNIFPTLASLFDISDAFDNFRLEWRDLFNFWGSLGQEVMQFFSDPLEWVYNKLDEFFERYW